MTKIEQSSAELIAFTGQNLAERLELITGAPSATVHSTVQAIELFIRAIVADEAQKMARAYLK